MEKTLRSQMICSSTSRLICGFNFIVNSGNEPQWKERKNSLCCNVSLYSNEHTAWLGATCCNILLIE